MYTLPSFPITGSGQTIPINLTDPKSVPNASGNPVKAVVLLNTSGYFLEVTTSGGVGVQTIPPGMNDLILFDAVTNNVTVTVLVDPLMLGNHGQGAQAVQLQGTVYEANDPLPTGAYPMVNPAFTVAPPGAELTIGGGTLTIPAGGARSLDVTVPNGIQTLMCLVDLAAPLPPLPTALEVQSSFDLSFDTVMFLAGQASPYAFLNAEAGANNLILFNNNSASPVTIQVSVYALPFPFKDMDDDHATWQYGGLQIQTLQVNAAADVNFVPATNTFDLGIRLHKMCVTPVAASATIGTVVCHDTATPNNVYGVVVGTQGESNLLGVIAAGTPPNTGPINVKNNTADAVNVTLTFDYVKIQTNENLL